MAEFGEFGNFTLYYKPVRQNTGFAPDESGYTFSGINKLDFTPFSYFEIHTDSDFNVLDSLLKIRIRRIVGSNYDDFIRRDLY